MFRYIFSAPFWAIPNNFVLHIFSVPLCASSLSIYISLDLQCPIMCKFSNFFHFVISLVSHFGQVPYLFTFHQIFSVPLCASSPFFSISLYLQCPILGKFPIYLHSIRYSVSHFGQVPYLFTFHQIFSVPFGASSLSIYIPLDLQCPIMCKFSIFLHSIISFVSHSGQVPYSFTFHYFFSVPLCASSPYFYISFCIQCPLCGSSQTSYVSLYLQCPILGKYPIILCFIIYLVSHYVQVPYLFTFHYFLCAPLCASSPSFYLSLYVQCPIMCMFSIFLHSIISLVSHFGQVPYLFTFHQIFSVPFGASSLSIYIPLDLQCPIMCKFSIFLHSIISFVSHSGQVPYSFTFHYFFSVPLCASSPYFYISFCIQCPIIWKFPNFLCFVISSVSHSGQVPYSFTFHYIFSVPLCASSPYFYISFYIQCPILCKFPNFLCFVISSVSHSGQVPNNFVLHYIFSVPLCASSLSFYLSLFPLCTIMCKFSFFLPFIICSVSHYVQVLHIFTFHSIFSVPFCASSLTSYVSLYLQCPIVGKYPIILCFIISSVSHYVQVLHIFTFHSIFSVPFCASSLTSYVSLYLQCPILGKYPIILCFIIYLVSHYVQVPYLFTFHYFLCAPLCASSPSFYLSLYVQCPIMCKFSIFLHSIISFVSHFGQVPYLFTFHQIFSVPFWASSLSIYISLYLQCPILGKFPIYLHSIRSSVSHYVQVPYLFTFHYFFVSHYVQVLLLFTFHYMFSVPLCASSPYFYISFYIQCPILCKFPNFLCFVISSVSHCGQVPNNFVLHYIFSVPLCASSLSIYISLDLQCPIMFKFSIFSHFIISLVSHFGQVPYLFTFHQIFSVPFWASSLSIYISLYLQCPIMCKFTIFLRFIIFSVSHFVQVP